MKEMTDSAGSTLEWIEPKVMQNFFELRDEAKSLYASLTFRTPFGSFAVAETAHGTWSFKRVGFLNPGVTVRSQGAAEDLALSAGRPAPVYDPEAAKEAVAAVRAAVIATLDTLIPTPLDNTASEAAQDPYQQVDTDYDDNDE